MNERVEKLAEYLFIHFDEDALVEGLDWERAGRYTIKQELYRERVQDFLAFLSTLGCVWLAEDQSWPSFGPWAGTPDFEPKTFEERAWFTNGKVAYCSEASAAGFRRIEEEK